jgi:hypothetical protein
MSRHPAKFAKRQKELGRVQKREDKAKKKADKKDQAQGTGSDSDIDWIVPGPQPAAVEEPEPGDEEPVDGE